MLLIRRGSYSGRAVVAWSTNSDYALNEVVFGGHFVPTLSGYYEDVRYRGRIGKIRNPSDVVLFSDAKRVPVGPTNWMPDGMITWRTDWTIDRFPKRHTLGDAFRPHTGVLDKRMFDNVRHKNKLNVAFADGHVSLLRIEPGDLDNAVLRPAK
jgi:prepilin-type processing-associated H-X9-DG protein